VRHVVPTIFFPSSLLLREGEGTPISPFLFSRYAPTPIVMALMIPLSLALQSGGRGNHRLKCFLSSLSGQPKEGRRINHLHFFPFSSARIVSREYKQAFSPLFSFFRYLARAKREGKYPEFLFFSSRRQRQGSKERKSRPFCFFPFRHCGRRPLCHSGAVLPWLPFIPLLLTIRKRVFLFFINARSNRSALPSFFFSLYWTLFRFSCESHGIQGSCGISTLFLFPPGVLHFFSPPSLRPSWPREVFGVFPLSAAHRTALGVRKWTTLAFLFLLFFFAFLIQSLRLSLPCFLFFFSLFVMSHGLAERKRHCSIKPAAPPPPPPFFFHRKQTSRDLAEFSLTPPFPPPSPRFC